MSAEHPQQRWKLTISERSLDDLADGLAAWLAGKVGSDAIPRITSIARPESSGMSSTSLLFDAEWTAAGKPGRGSFVARMPPGANDFPVLPTYDLARQYHVMERVAAHSAVPVPQLCWLESGENPLGTELFVMKKVDGRVPVDNPPYVFVGWLLDATADERAVLTRNTLQVLAALHAIPNATTTFPMLAEEGSTLREHVDDSYAWYRWALRDDGFEIPCIERAFTWLDENWPVNPGPDVLSWGDARPGNIIYDGFTPAAVLDWEMAAIGPRELDLAWMIFLHRFFQDIATTFNQPGLPDFMRRDQMVEQYQQLTGHIVGDLDFYLVYSAVRHAIVMARVRRRMIHFNEDTAAAPTDYDDYVMHRGMLDAMLAGTYQW